MRLQAFLAAHDGGADRDLAAVRHRIARVDQDVQQGHLEMRRIEHAGRQPGAQVESQLDPVAQRTRQHLGEIEDLGVDVQRFRFQALLACEGQQLLGELAGAHGGALGAFQGDARLVRPAQVEQRHFEVAVDDLQQVVEVVRHAGRELADRFHLLRLQVGFLGLAARCHVHLRGEEVQQLALLVEDRPEEQGVPERRAVGLVVQQVDRDGTLFPDRLAHLVDRGAVGVAALQQAAIVAQDLVLAVAGQVEEGAVREHDRVVRQAWIGDQHRHARHGDGGEEDVVALADAVVLDVAGLPVLEPRTAHRAFGISLDLAIRGHADAAALALFVELLLQAFFLAASHDHVAFLGCNALI